MLTDPKEIECVKDAWEPGIANPDRPRVDFENILASFFHGNELGGKRVLDLGPGHYDFGELARPKGAEVVAVELDPSVIKLGSLKGFEVIEGDVYDFEVLTRNSGKFDGLFCRGSFNSRNFEDEETHLSYLDALISVVKENGWWWISPCNDPKGDLEGDEKYGAIVEIQKRFFRERGFDVIEDEDAFTSLFGIYSTEPRLLYLKGLKYDREKIAMQYGRARQPSLGERIVRKIKRVIGR